MFGQRGRHERQGEGEASEPLLNESDEGHVVFSADDDDLDDDDLPLALSKDDRQEQQGHVRFREEVQVIAPPMRSTTASREAAFELDSDELEDDAIISLENARSRQSSRRREQRAPLLVGLLEQSSRRSLDGSLPLVGTNESEQIDIQELAAKANSGGGMLDSIANMANSILGAGIIGLPYAVSQAGFFTGVFLLVVLCLVTDWTIRLIVINAKLSGSTSYMEIMSKCFGSSGRAAVSFFQFAFAFGGMCAFSIIIGDTIPHVIRSIFPTLYKVPVLYLFTNRQFVIALCTLCVSYPLSLYRDIHKLSRASGLALIGMLIIVSSVLIEGPSVPPELKGDPDKRYTIVQPGVFQAIGVISFAFVCHHNSLLIYGSLRTPTMDRFNKVTHASTAISLVACMTLAISAFLVFTDKTQGNILNNFPGSDTLINIARFCFGLNMFTTLPLELFVCREVIEDYFFSHETFNPTRHLFFTTTLLISSMLVSMITCDLGVTLEITGGVSATALAFIFPAACYLSLVDPQRPWHARDKLPAVVCVAFGAIVMTISLVQALGKTWSPEGGATICI